MFSLSLGLGSSTAASQCCRSGRGGRRWHVQVRVRRGQRARGLQARPLDEVEPVPPFMLEQHGEGGLQAEAAWLAGMVRCWLDEEWTPLEVHGELGAAVGAAYARLRSEGVRDASDVLLGLANELLAFEFRETFTGPFDVANKSLELLMLRQGCDVCCTTPADREAIQRYERQLAEERGGGSGGGPPPT